MAGCPPKEPKGNNDQSIDVRKEKRINRERESERSSDGIADAFGVFPSWIRCVKCEICGLLATNLDLNASRPIYHTLDPSDFRLYGSRGCLGCCTKPTPIIAVDEPSKGLRIQGRSVKNPSISEDFWSTSTCDMDNSAIQSQRSVSSISISNQVVDPHSGAGSTSSPPEFLNHGLLLWNQTRQQWLGNKQAENWTQQLREPRLSRNATYESLLGTNKPFPQPIPLFEMVDFLVDIWEQEGMYD